MNDQAQSLRNLVSTAAPVERQTKIITVTSGKGGVGKSNFTLNFALGLQAKGCKVLVFDADIGFSNIDVLMGVSPSHTLYHLLKREKTIFDIINLGYNGLQFIAGGSGFNDLMHLSEAELNYFTEQVNLLNGTVDYIIFDTGAGLSNETLKFIVAAEQTFVVTTPEPTSITDAYAIIKMVNNLNHHVNFKLIVNRVASVREGQQTAEKIALVAQKFLDLSIPTLGYVYDDAHVSKAVKQQVPFSVAFPHGAAARSVTEIVERFIAGEKVEQSQTIGGVRGFLQKMMNLIK